MLDSRLPSSTPQQLRYVGRAEDRNVREWTKCPGILNGAAPSGFNDISRHVRLKDSTHVSEGRPSFFGVCSPRSKLVFFSEKRGDFCCIEFLRSECHPQSGGIPEAAAVLHGGTRTELKMGDAADDRGMRRTFIVPAIKSFEHYDFTRAKISCSLTWLVAKAFGSGRSPLNSWETLL